MKSIIISGGKAPSEKLLKKELSECDYIVCADSGADCIYKYNIKPDIILGDFDSVSNEAFEYYKNLCKEVIKYPREKDFTDTELALKEALKVKPDEIVFLGCTGTRMDHFMGNLGLLDRCVDKGVKSYIKDDNNTIFIIDKTTTLYGNKGDLFSVQAFMNEVINFSIYDAKYPLNNYNLKFGDPRTTSNEFLDKPVTISFDSGKVIVIRAKD